VTKRAERRWVACSREVSYAASTHRHLAYPGSLHTACGNTASHADIWRGNSTKPPCPSCLKAVGSGK
jgi:hypothetical protein